MIQIRKNHPCFRLSSTEEIENGVRFDSIYDQVLVYDCIKEHDHCIAFFNPTNIPYDYHLKENCTILFDNGQCNNEQTQDVHIAAFSVVICQFAA